MLNGHTLSVQSVDVPHLLQFSQRQLTKMISRSCCLNVYDFKARDELLHCWVPTDRWTIAMLAALKNASTFLVARYSMCRLFRILPLYVEAVPVTAWAATIPAAKPMLFTHESRKWIAQPTFSKTPYRSNDVRCFSRTSGHGEKVPHSDGKVSGEHTLRGSIKWSSEIISATDRIYKSVARLWVVEFLIRFV